MNKIKKKSGKFLNPVYPFIFVFCCFFLIFSVNNCFASDGLFGSRETKYKTFTLFPKWVGVLSRHKVDVKESKLPCTSEMETSCIFLQWKDFLNTVKDKTIIEQLDEVNRNINKHRYVTDIANWGVEDYWETPKEFFFKDGDCEDFAIAKFKSLLYLGFNSDNMRIVVLQDLNLQVAHAVLAVYVNDKRYILDNQAEQVIPDDEIKHYMPIYSINEHNWWRHS